MTPSLGVDDVRRARTRIAGAVRCTPCTPSPALSALSGGEVLLKLENLQLTGSFKERGACNKLLSLSPAETQRGVVAASAGNHAQGVAFHARRLGVDATIVMPRSTPLVKVTSTQSYGANVVLCGDSYPEARAEAERIAAEERRVLVHPFDDPEVIAGQGTLGLELCEQVPNLGAVVVAVGGGGLSAGVALAVKQTLPSARVIGVQTTAMPSLQRAREQGAPVEVPVQRTLAEGIAVDRIGELPFAILERALDELVLVDDEEIAQSILLLLEREKLLSEGAGAAPIAAVLSGRVQLGQGPTVVVVGGGNFDVNILSRVIDRGLVRSGRLMKVRLLLRDAPGELARLLCVLADCEANVLQVQHDRHGLRLELGQAVVELEVETRGYEHVAAIEAALQASGFAGERRDG